MKDKPEAEVRKPGINRWLLLAIVTIVGFVADLATKLWALANISLGN